MYVDKKQYIIEKIIKSHGPYKFFATLTFQRQVTDKEGFILASQFLKRLHACVFGEEEWLTTQRLEGVALLERTKLFKKSYGRDRGTCHFHFLIKDHPNLDARFHDAFIFGDAVSRAANSLNFKKKRKAVSKHGTNTQEVYSDNVISYVSKESRDFSWWLEPRLFFLPRHNTDECFLVDCDVRYLLNTAA